MQTHMLRTVASNRAPNSVDALVDQFSPVPAPFRATYPLPFDPMAREFSHMRRPSQFFR
jgi:hypothetical protein